jgi:hypothetical protein
MRCGGDKRGSAASRRARKRWLLETFGDGETCPCIHCQTTLDYDTVTADRIVPGASYSRSNIQPSCFACNRARSNDESWQPALVAG